MLERTCCRTPPGSSHTGTCPNSYANTGTHNFHLNHIHVNSHVDRFDPAIKNMNILNTTRIGDEDKTKYLDYLAELSANGYLNAEEYSARADWLFEAHTMEEVKVAFADLPRLRVTEVQSPPQLTKTKKKKSKKLPHPAVSGLIALIEFGCAAMLTYDGHWGIGLFLTCIGLLYTTMFVVRLRHGR